MITTGTWHFLLEAKAASRQLTVRSVPTFLEKRKLYVADTRAMRVSTPVVASMDAAYLVQLGVIELLSSQSPQKQIVHSSIRSPACSATKARVATCN
jgi:hypothetical protein